MKKIKLPLEMANGVMVRSLDELKENWDLEKVVEHFVTGKLTTWLNDRYYTDLAEKVENLPKDGDGRKLQQALCRVFEVPCEELELDVDEIAERKRRQDLLRQYTSDDEVLKNVDKVAFNQEDLADLLDEGVEKIYLCNGKFSVPLSVSGKKYIGVADAEVYIGKDELQDFDKLGISFENVKFDEKHQKLVDARSKKQKEEMQKSAIINFESAKKLYEEGKYEEAFRIFQVLADRKDVHAYQYLGHYYRCGLYVESNRISAAEWYSKAIDGGNLDAYADMTYLTKNLGWIEKGVAEGNKHCIFELAVSYRCGSEIVGGVENTSKAIELYSKIEDWYAVAWIYSEMLYNYKEALRYYIKAYKSGVHCAFTIAWCYCCLEDIKSQMMWYEKGIEEPIDSDAALCIRSLINSNYADNNLLELGKLSKKLDAIAEAQAVNDSDYIRCVVVESYARVGRIKDAIEWTDKIEGNGSRKEAYAEIGRVLFDGKVCAKNFSKAKEYFIKAKGCGDTNAFDDWIRQCDEELIKQ